MTEVSELFKLVEDFKAEFLSEFEVVKLQVEEAQKLSDKVAKADQKAEGVKQFLQEYKGYKDPASTRDRLDALNKMLDKHTNLLTALDSRLKLFEVKSWLRILSDEEIEAQYILAGKPSLSTVAKHFRTTPENAFNYVHAKVKDDKIRWEIYRYFGGA
jgi:hypothetical protein